MSMIDPPRAAVPDAVGKCRSAGIKVGGGDKQKNSPRFSEKNFFTKFTKTFSVHSRGNISPHLRNKNVIYEKILFPHIYEKLFPNIYKINTSPSLWKTFSPHLWTKIFPHILRKKYFHKFPKIKIHRFTKNLSPTLHFFPHIYKKPVPHINEQTIEPNLPKNYFTAFMKINI